MDRLYGEHRYKSFPVQDNAAGFTGVELHRLSRDCANCVAKVIYWDASGQLFIETCGTDLPVEIVEQLIAEARKQQESHSE